MSIIIQPDLDHLETGIWCSRCNLPSGWRAPIVALSHAGVGTLGTITRCGDCDQPIRNEATP